MTSEGGNQQKKAEAVAFGGHNNAASAQFQVGCVGFGAGWTAQDSMAASIVRLECEKDDVAMLNEQARILVEERDEARIQYRSTLALAEVLAKTQVKLKAERDEANARVAVLEEEQKILQRAIASLRDQLCADKCQDKAAADWNWSNI